MLIDANWSQSCPNLIQLGDLFLDLFVVPVLPCPSLGPGPARPRPRSCWPKLASEAQIGSTGAQVGLKMAQVGPKLAQVRPRLDHVEARLAQVGLR